MTKYVQHISGQGEKFELMSCCGEGVLLGCSIAFHIVHSGTVYSLPKSEYREVPPPERWVDVTGQIRFETWPSTKYSEAGAIIDANNVVLWELCCRIKNHAESYRLRKLKLFDHGQKNDGTAFLPQEQWAFIVEKREP